MRIAPWMNSNQMKHAQLQFFGCIKRKFDPHQLFGIFLYVYVHVWFFYLDIVHQCLYIYRKIVH